MPLVRISFPITFETPSNVHTETLVFEVVNLPGLYHTLLGRPCYAKFMAIPNYTYLKLKMSGPKGVITVSPSLQHAIQCETKNSDLADAMMASTGELEAIRADLEEETRDASHKNAMFKPVEDTKEVQIDPEGDKEKTVRVGTSLTPK